MSEWRSVAIEDLAANTKSALATGPFGSAVSKKHFVDEGVPMIRGSNLSIDVGVRLDDSEVVFLPEEVASKFERSIVRTGDLVFTCWGTIGQVGLIEESRRFDRYLVSNKQMKMTPDHSIADSRFLYYALSSPENLDQVQRQAIGAAVPGFNLGQLRQIRIRVPGLETQRAIAAVLRSMDDLIENNRRRIEVLEEMAQAIYREWFVHFRFPGHESATLKDSTLGPIPEDWEVVPSSVAVAINPRTQSDKSVSDPFVTMGDLSTSSAVCFPSGSKEGTSGSKFLNGDTLFARITPCLENGKTGLVSFLEPGQVGRGSTEFVVLRGERVGRAFTYCLARQPEFRRNAQASMVGASGRQRIRNECFDTYLLTAPSAAVSEAFEATVGPLFDLGFVLAQGNERLSEMRDRLLPKLVTGEIDVSKLDLDELVESAS